jgi:triosephosphate isomerase
MKRYWIGTGWKMNHLIGEAEDYAKSLKQFVSLAKPVSNIFICVPFTSLHLVSTLLSGTDITVAAQNSHWLDRGAFTGEISPLMVKDAGATMIEIGHSERREFFGENDETVHLKVQATLAHGLRPLICIGETLQEKKYDVSIETLKKQLKIALLGLTAQQMEQILIAYEPVWAIGDSGVPAEPEYVEFIHAQINHTVCQLAGDEIGNQVPVIYGGSVNSMNAISFFSMPHVDGLFIGRSAWKVEGFTSIIKDVEAFLN